MAADYSSIASTVFITTCRHTPLIQKKEMGERYLKEENQTLIQMYPTATKSEILVAIPGRGWIALCIHAKRLGIYRTTAARGLQIWAGRIRAKREREEEGDMK